MNTAHRQLVHRFIDWKLIDHRLSKYPAIARAFDLSTIKAAGEKPPYYCHYMAWRLGTWKTEGLFTRLEELLHRAESLPNWKYERPLLSSPGFEDFWSLIWQLQVAEYLVRIGSQVQWAESGPDLSVVICGEKWFVECYTLHKSFGLLVFLTELLKRIDSAICTNYDLCMPFQLPRNSDRVEFLDTVLEPFLNPSYLAHAKGTAKNRYPVVLYEHPESSLIVYVEGNDVDAYDPGAIPNRVGSPEGYLKVALQEAANAKKKSNALKEHKPNIVAVNYLLSTDYQLAISLRRAAFRSFDVSVDSAIDALAVAAVGIDEYLAQEALTVIHGCHPALHRIGVVQAPE